MQKQFAYNDKVYNFTMGTGGTISLLVFSKEYDLKESHSVNSKKLFMNWKDLSDEEFGKEAERIFYVLCKIENILTKEVK